MTSVENFGPQFADHILVHRGIQHVNPSVVNSHGIGIHWSHDKDIAHRFATDDNMGYEEHPEDNQAVVLSALVHKKDVIEPYSDEWHEMSESGMDSEIYDPEHSEQEATVRPGSPVHVVGVHHYYDAQKVAPMDFEGPEDLSQRRMTYKTPRVGEA
jgi:hypothetical protein